MANLIPSGAGASPVSQTLGSDLYYPIPNAIGFSTAAATASRLRVHPFYVPSACKVQRIGGEVTAAGSSGGKIRVVVYAMRTGLNASKPGALVWDSGVDGDTSTYTNDGYLDGASIGAQSIDDPRVVEVAAGGRVDVAGQQQHREPVDRGGGGADRPRAIPDQTLARHLDDNALDVIFKYRFDSWSKNRLCFSANVQSIYVSSGKSDFG